MTMDRRDEASTGSGSSASGAEDGERWREGSTGNQHSASGAGGERWREVVRLLEDNARARTRLEAVETSLLREARACDVPARLGYVSLEEFAECWRS